jgi:hypothetical protein
MIQKTLTLFCDGCAKQEALVSKTLKEAVSEVDNKGWTTEGKEHYCEWCTFHNIRHTSPEAE